MLLLQMTAAWFKYIKDFCKLTFFCFNFLSKCQTNTFLTGSICISQRHWQLVKLFISHLPFLDIYLLKQDQAQSSSLGLKVISRLSPRLYDVTSDPLAARLTWPRLFLGSINSSSGSHLSEFWVGSYHQHGATQTELIISLSYFSKPLSALLNFEQIQGGTSVIGIFFNSRNTFSDKCIISN